MSEKLFDDLAKELGADIEYDQKRKIAVIKSKVGNTVTFFGIPLSEETNAVDPDEAVKKKIRKVMGIGRNKAIRNTPVTGRVDHNDRRDRVIGRQEEPIRNEAGRVDGARMHRNRSHHRRVPAGVRVQQERRKKMREPSLKDTILITITVVAFLLALSGAEMLTNMDPHPLAGCICLALGSTWILLIAFANSRTGKEFMEDVRCLK